MIWAVCRRASGKQKPTAKQVQLASKKRSTQDEADHDLNYATLETTNDPPLSPTTYEMDTFYPVRWSS